MVTAREDGLSRVLAAVSDPVRRNILQVLSGGPLPVNDVVERFAISRPAVSRHLRLLRHAGLVQHDVVGRQRIYRLDPAPLALVDQWLVSVRAPVAEQWSRRLDALETEVRRTSRQRRHDQPLTVSRAEGPTTRADRQPGQGGGGAAS